MKNSRTLYTSLGIAVLIVSGCSKPAAPSEPPQPAATPEATPAPSATPQAEITPNPAKGAAQAAIQFYPDLAKKDSAFNLMFLDLYEDRKKNDPASLAGPDWPLELSQEVGNKLGIKPVQTNIAANGQSHQQSTPALGKDWKDPLDKGAYNKDKHAMHGEPWINYIPRP